MGPKGIASATLKYFFFKATSFSTLLVTLLGLGVLLLFFVNCLLFCYVHKRQKRKKIQGKWYYVVP